MPGAAGEADGELAKCDPLAYDGDMLNATRGAPYTKPDRSTKGCYTITLAYKMAVVLTRARPTTLFIWDGPPKGEAGIT